MILRDIYGYVRSISIFDLRGMGILSNQSLRALKANIKGGNFEGPEFKLKIFLVEAIVRVMIVSLTLVVQ